MKVRFTDRALADIEEIYAYVAASHPRLLGAVKSSIQAAIARISVFPKIAQSVPERKQVRAMTLLQYPYKIFYQIEGGGIEIVRIYHTSRRPLE